MTAAEPDDAQLTCWHAECDTMPRVRQARDGIEVRLPVGAWSEAGVPPAVRIEVEAAVRPAGTGVDWEPVQPAQIRPVTRFRLEEQVLRAHADRGEPGRLSATLPYVDLSLTQREFAANRYFEAVFTGLPPGGLLDYTVAASARHADGTVIRRSPARRYRIQLVAPEFGPDDVWTVHGDLTGAADPACCVVMAQRDDAAGFDHLRVDLLVLPEAPAPRPAVVFELPDGRRLDVGRAGGLHCEPVDGELIDWLPIVDRNVGSVVLSVPRAGGQPLESVTLTVGGERFAVDLGPGRGDARPVNVLLLNYCIQGQNDLFSRPLSGYHPPRTYGQITVRDEAGLYCSRPQAREDGEPDGYALTLAAHRYYGVKSEWAFNAGVLSLIAHDSPEELRKLRLDVAAGLLKPVNAGFGAHRPKYYAEETNVRELDRGAEVIRNVLWHGRAIPKGSDPGEVYYPDQRLFAGQPQELRAYARAGVKYLVLDRSTVCGLVDGVTRQFFEHPDPAANQLIGLAGTGLTLLLIEDELRGGLLSGSDQEIARGQLGIGVRRFLMSRLPALPGGAPTVVVYGDDADKASGAGWFDGDYAGRRLPFNAGYQSALCWIAAHPWVRAVTTADLAGLRPALTLDVTSSSCPSVDPRGAATVDGYGYALHFDKWHDVWSQFRAVWLDASLGELATELESTLVGWSEPEGRRQPEDELYELAWLYFLTTTHEGFWNKEPLERDVNQARGVLDPEDFVVSSSLQQRNAWVYLNASVWYQWAKEQAGPEEGETFVDGGPVIERVQRLRTAPAPFGDGDGLYWDHDLLPNVIAYNRHALLVLDRNGGCCTQIFVRGSDRPVSVSGTLAAYQFIDTGADGKIGHAVACDGEVLQNTVPTPNHAYVAGDLRQSRPTRGTVVDPRRPDDVQAWLYPANFDEYRYDPSRPVTFSYQPGTEVARALDIDGLRELLAKDREARRSGSSGVVWHDPLTPEFSKRIELVGRTVYVSYRDVPPGHVVSNEFCVDLFTAVLHGPAQEKVVGPDAGWVSLISPTGLAVTVRLGANCRFRRAALVERFADAVARGPADAGDYLELHRVLSDNLQLVCEGGGSFDYAIELPDG